MVPNLFPARGLLLMLGAGSLAPRLRNPGYLLRAPLGPGEYTKVSDFIARL